MRLDTADGSIAAVFFKKASIVTATHYQKKLH